MLRNIMREIKEYILEHISIIEKVVSNLDTKHYFTNDYESKLLCDEYNLDAIVLRLDDKFHNNLDYISIDIIKAKRRNKGYGTKFLNDLCRYADNNNKILTLTPVEYFNVDKSTLIEFYKKFGFVHITKRDIHTKNTMIRYPKNNSTNR